MEFWEAEESSCRDPSPIRTIFKRDALYRDFVLAQSRTARTGVEPTPATIYTE
jgi:hypothetical protein